MSFTRQCSKSIAVAVFTALFTAGCATNGVSGNYIPSAQYDLATQVVHTDIQQLWTKDFDHHKAGLLKQVADAISAKAKSGNLNDPALDKLSYYLRIFASFGPDEGWPEGTAEAVNHALSQLTQMSGFYQINATSARLHENYATALYRLYLLEPLQPMVASQVKPLAKLLELYATAQLPQDKAVDYGLWEVLRAAALLPYEARQKNTDAFIDAVTGEGELKHALLNFLNAANAHRGGEQWPLEHALWALAHHYNLHNKQYWNEYYKRSEEERKKLDDDKLSLPVEGLMDELDNKIWQALQRTDRTEAEIKQIYSVPYVVNSYRSKSDCEKGDLKGRCIAPTVEQALPVKHVCSDSLYILAQDLSEQQLKQSCERLTAQESSFHHKLATNQQPVANDFNQSLRVVIFDDQAQYNIFGQLVFDIYTDNGGMYIEDTPQNPENIATFYSYEQFWARPDFKVWNLNHEYVHYLDGRFVKYDGFGHFPSNMVWWSEGLAEYIALGDNNPKIGKLLGKTEPSDFLTLQQVFDTEYKDGTDQVYKWGYLAVRYMYEKQRETYHKLANYLTTDYFDGYKKLLDESGKKFQDEFAAYLLEMKEKTGVSEAAKDPREPRQFYRYSYRPYLQPAHLKEDPWHMHWQYWHANAQKSEQKTQAAGKE